MQILLLHYEVYRRSFILTGWKNNLRQNSDEEKSPLTTIKNAPCLTLLCWLNASQMYSPSSLKEAFWIRYTASPLKRWVFELLVSKLETFTGKMLVISFESPWVELFESFTWTGYLLKYHLMYATESLVTRQRKLATPPRMAVVFVSSTLRMGCFLDDSTKEKKYIHVANKVLQL